MKKFQQKTIGIIIVGSLVLGIQPSAYTVVQKFVSLYAHGNGGG
ncbi:hypothetical protein ACT7DJ_14400 [Bacillus cereus]